MPTIVIVPIKEHSSRIPNKNFRQICGKPLFYHIINMLLKCDMFDKVIINIDTVKVESEIGKYFKDNHKLVMYYRPYSLNGDIIATNDLLLDTVKYFNFSPDTVIVQTHITNPLLNSETIKHAYNTYVDNLSNGYDSLYSATKLQSRLYDKNGSEINHQRFKLIPTQDLDPIYEDNSCFYITDVRTLTLYKSRIGQHPYIYPIDHLEAVDIDWEHDFQLAEILLTRKLNSRKNVLVTGANGGIGQAVCNIFQTNGWNVIKTDLDSGDYKSDLGKLEDIQKLVRLLTKDYVKLDCLVNCGAMQICKKIQDTSLDEWDKVFNINLKAVYQLVLECLPLFKKSNAPSVVNIGSIHSIATSKSIGVYSVSKSALAGLTRTMAVDLSEYGIRVNCISPGAIHTPMLISGLDRGGKNLDSLKDKHLNGRIGQPGDVAGMVYQVGTNQFINGSNLVIDGGASICLSTE